MIITPNSLISIGGSFRTICGIRWQSDSNNGVAVDGYCRKTHEEEAQGSEGQGQRTRDDWTAGTGMGEGGGLNDISQEIENEDMMDGYKGEEQYEKDEGNTEASSNPIEASTNMEINAPLEAVDDNKDEGSVHDEDEDMEQNMGDVNLSEGGELERKNVPDKSDGNSGLSDEEDNGGEDEKRRQEQQDNIETQNGDSRNSEVELEAKEDAMDGNATTSPDPKTSDTGTSTDKHEDHQTADDQNETASASDHEDEAEDINRNESACININLEKLNQDDGDDAHNADENGDTADHSDGDDDFDMNSQGSFDENRSVATEENEAADDRDDSATPNHAEEDTNNNLPDSDDLNTSDQNDDPHTPLENDDTYDGLHPGEDPQEDPSHSGAEEAEDNQQPEDRGVSKPPSARPKLKSQHGVRGSSAQPDNALFSSEQANQLNSSDDKECLSEGSPDAGVKEDQCHSPPGISDAGQQSSMTQNEQQSSSNGISKGSMSGVSQEEASRMPQDFRQSQSSGSQNQTSTRPSAPNPITSTPEAIERWLEQVVLFQNENEDPDMSVQDNAPTPDEDQAVQHGTACKKDASSHQKGLAETCAPVEPINDQKTPDENGFEGDQEKQQPPTTSQTADIEDTDDDSIAPPAFTPTTIRSAPSPSPDEVPSRHNEDTNKDNEDNTEGNLDGSLSAEQIALLQRKATLEQQLGVRGSSDADEDMSAAEPEMFASLPNASVESCETEETALYTNDDRSNHATDPLLSEAQGYELWRQYGAETAASAVNLCEQLRIIMEPTLKGRFSGDFRTGKRLSMRKVVTFIASNFRRDKIWLRRCRPSRRDYRIVLALDNSRSMSENGVGQSALKAVVTVCQAFQRLEIGKTGICAFGGHQPEVILPLQENVFNEDTGSRIIRSFTFDQESDTSHDQALPTLFDVALNLFCGVRTENSGLQSSVQETKSSTQITYNDPALNAEIIPPAHDLPPVSKGDFSTQQMLLIISDGRFNKRLVKNKVNAALDRGVIPMLIIIDATRPAETLPETSRCKPAGNTATSKTSGILEMKEVFWDSQGTITVRRYLDDFPFPFFAVVNHIGAIPNVVCDVIRQWIEMSARR